jgi:hypothetical protein
MDTWLHLAHKASTLQKGASLFVLAWVAVWLLGRWPAAIRPLNRVVAWVPIGLPMSVLGLGLVYTIAYLAHPTYADHVEASVQVAGQHLLQGDPLYPVDPGPWLNGLLYGPLLGVLNALSASLPMDPFLSSKLTAVIATGVALVLCQRPLHDRRAWPMLAFLAVFEMLIFNRAEPHLLLVTALACQCAGWADRRRQALALGLLAGLGMALKVHGLLYVAAVAWWAMPGVWREPVLWPRLMLGALVGCLPWFLLPGIDLVDHLRMLRLASQHGLVPRILLDNLVFLLALWLPLLSLRVGLPGPLPLRLSTSHLAVLASLELLLALLGSKRGAGCWHLLPLVPLHAIVLQDLLAAHGPLIRPERLRQALLPLTALAISASVVLGSGAWRLAQERQPMSEARAELASMARQHPGLVLAPGADRGYELTYLRVDLERQGMRQVDVPAFVDLQWAGVSDAPLADALRGCGIRHVVVPRGERPFAKLSGYSGQALFSPAVQQALAERFRLVSRSTHFDLYQCQAPS